MNGQTWHPCSNMQKDSSEKEYVLDWPIVPNTWWMKICINLSREEVLALEDADSNCNRGRHFHHIVGYWQSQCLSFLSCILACWVILMPTQFPYFRKQCVQMQQNPQQITKTTGRTPDSWIDTMFIPYMSFGVIINIVSKEDNIHHIIICDIPQRPCPDFTKGEKENGCITNAYTMCSNLFAKWTLRTTGSFMLQHTHTTKCSNTMMIAVYHNKTKHSGRFA